SHKLDEADSEAALQSILRNVKTQARLVEDLLDVSRIVSGKLDLDIQPVELQSVILEAISTLRPEAEAKGISLRAVLDAAVGNVSGDPHRLLQIIWNLLSNAIKFTPKGGSIEICLERAGSEAHSQAQIEVRDTGIGISAEFLPFVFERLRQADSSSTRPHGGLGLGLAIVRHLTELHCGEVRANSPGIGQGATFSITLPLRAQPPTTVAQSRHEDETLL
ncbi:MAG: hypothetical protein JWN98_1159, partial [Abditibacteriota bacterium]|nr:hypothetical protein [Abditibacteriota bacterium]